AGRVRRAKLGLTEDMWCAAGDPLGRDFIAAGTKGHILSGSPGSLRVTKVGSEDLYACWFDNQGAMWVAGVGGTLYQRKRRAKWKAIKSPIRSDWLTGGSDARDHQLLASRGGAVWQRDANGKWTKLRNGGPELTSIVGFIAKASYIIPRSARRIEPSRVALPPARLQYPANVERDGATPVFERTTPIRGFKTPLLMGAMTFGGVWPKQRGGCEACYNTALLLGAEGQVIDLVDKSYLLVFGEYIPLGERYPELYDWLPEASRFQPGQRTRPMEFQGSRLGIMVCYEDLLPRHAQRLAAHDPHVFINLTNDAWFGQTAEPYHHLQLAQMRTVEYRRWLIRSTNTGVSVFIDAAGRRVKETKLTGAETLLHSVPMLEGRTVYAVLGDWPAWILVVALLLIWARAFRNASPPTKSKTKRPSKSSRTKPKRPAKPTSKKPRKKPPTKPRKPRAPEVLEPERLS
ncbi:MAG TPA: apolipoprotein N-acyltransferase, partial [Myxococcales bacterium]|nr:apolipoprotein N-acyltransferase [Myxococcales bacterium]